MTEYKYPKIDGPLRVLVCGCACSAWYDEDDNIRAKKVLPLLCECFEKIRDKYGANLITTFDDDLFMVGVPKQKKWSFYIIYEVPSIETVNDMINLFRTPNNGIRLDRYFSIEAVIGRKFFPAE